MDALMLGSVNVNDGATYWLADGFTPGVGPVELASVESLLDGDRLAGGRTGNREITLPVVILARTRLALAAAVAAVSTQADQPQFTLTHTPDDALPVIYDCFRATVTKTSSFKDEKFNFVARLTISCQALPFARNPTVTTRSVTMGAAAGTQLDACDSLTVPGTVNSGVSLDTVSKVEGTASLRGSNNVMRTFTTPQNFTGFAQLSAATMIFGSDESAFAGGTFNLTLRDTTGGSLVYAITPGANRFNFVRVSIPLSQPAYGTQTFNFAAVASYQFLFTPNLSGSSNTVWIDDVRGVADATSTGRVLRLGGVQGTARTPITSMTITAPSGTHKQLLVARWNDQPATFTPVLDAGSGTADGLASNGTAQSAGTVDLPIVSANFRPGVFQVYVLLRNTTGAPQLLSAQARVTTDNLANGTLRYGSQVVTSASIPSSSSYVIVFVGELELPALPVATTNTAARTFLRLTGGGTAIDEVYVIPTDSDVAFLDGLNDAVVQLTADTGTINAFAGPTASTLLGASDRQLSQGALLLRPGDNDILVVDNAQVAGGPISPTVALTYHERWHFERAV